MRTVAIGELQGWFKPKVMDGEWVSDGIVAVRASGASVGDMSAILNAPTRPGQRARIANGYDRIADKVFNGHLLDFVAAAYPGCSWAIAEHGCAVALIGEEKVGLVMKVHGDPNDADSMHQVQRPRLGATLPGLQRHRRLESRARRRARCSMTTPRKLTPAPLPGHPGVTVTPMHTPGSPSGYYVVTMAPGAEMPEHAHPNAETIIACGLLGLVVDGRSVLLDEGEALDIPPGVPHAVAGSRVREVRYVSIATPDWGQAAPVLVEPSILRFFGRPTWSVADIGAFEEIHGSIQDALALLRGHGYASSLGWDLTEAGRAALLAVTEAARSAT